MSLNFLIDNFFIIKIYFKLLLLTQTFGITSYPKINNTKENSKEKSKENNLNENNELILDKKKADEFNNTLKILQINLKKSNEEKKKKIQEKNENQIFNNNFLNNFINEIKIKISQIEFTNKLIIFFSIRIFCCIFSFFGFFWTTIFFSYLQFLFLPYSFSMSFIKLFEIFFHLFSGYIIIFPIFFYSSKFFCPKILDFYLEINNNFILGFFLIDFFFNLIFTFWTPSKGRTEKMVIKKTLKCIFFGYLNTKSYFFILFFLLKNSKINTKIYFVFIYLIFSLVYLVVLMI
jgi:hypothetical protein